MPSKNTVKKYAENAFYHVYNRGVNKQEIFLDEKDYSVFLNLLKRYLSKEKDTDKKGRVYENYYDRLDLLAFCLMPNHFHLFVFQEDKDVMTSLLKSVCGSYTMYFNKRYKRVGPLFQGRFKASSIDNDAYYMHISRYIHLNPNNYKSWEWSSLPYYTNRKDASWVKPALILEMFSSVQEYEKFLETYIESEEELTGIESSLADL